MQEVLVLFERLSDLWWLDIRRHLNTMGANGILFVQKRCPYATV